MRAKLFFAVCAVTFALSAISTAQAEILDVYAYVPTSSGTTPSNPIVSDDGTTVTWGSDWTVVTLPETFEIEAGGSIYLALENLYREKATKIITLTYECSVELDVTAALAGYPDGSTTAWDSVSIALGSLSILYVATGTIEPQPSWEWVQLTNTGNAPVTISVVSYVSECVPEPSSIALLIVGAFGLTIRCWRKR